MTPADCQHLERLRTWDGCNSHVARQEIAWLLRLVGDLLAVIADLRKESVLWDQGRRQGIEEALDRALCAVPRRYHKAVETALRTIVQGESP
jgi:hypothetical protein